MKDTQLTFTLKINIIIIVKIPQYNGNSIDIRNSNPSHDKSKRKEVGDS